METVVRDMRSKIESTVLYVAPPVVIFLAHHPMVKSSDLDSIHTILCGGGGAVVSDVEKLYEKMGKETFRHGYGLTETSGVLTFSCPTMPFSSVGAPLPSTLVKIIAEDGSILGPNQPGELCCKGPQVMKCYHNNEKATKEVLDEEGYFHTGDVAYFNDLNILFLVDRKKELIKVKGFQVAPMELENVIKSHSSVLDVAVIGVPDDRCGEKPLAFVVLNNNDNKPSEKELQDFVSSKVAPYKQLKGVVYIEAIPKNTTGKILRRVLRENYTKPASYGTR